jgi:ANTAR domain-containing protein
VDDASGDVTAQCAAIVAHARDLREQAQRLMAPRDAVAAATEADIRDYLRNQPPQARQDLLQRSPYARLVARLETLPVIEQAKGIVMAQWHCGPDEAFEMLREASQRCNVPIRELAGRLVVQTSQPASHPTRP